VFESGLLYDGKRKIFRSNDYLVKISNVKIFLKFLHIG
jgi:hypothetical protein